MEPTSEGKTVLSDIEQDIQNALSLMLGIKDIDGMFNEDSAIDEQTDFFQMFNQLNPFHPPGLPSRESSPAVVKTVGPLSPKSNGATNSEAVYNKSPFRNINPSQESVKLPFLENPIQSTVQEMQRVLNSRSDSFPLKVEPSPEEILNLFSQDLGICTSSNASPRGGGNRADSFERVAPAKSQTKEKKHSKKVKQEKAKQAKKTQESKGKTNKSDKPKENKLKDLMKIYGQTDKVKKPHSDSTLGSKSEVSRHPSKKMLQNGPSKANSIAASKKSKKRKQKFPKNIDMDLCNEYLIQEKSSKLSSKRKNRNSTVNIAKKPCLKRRTSTKRYGDVEVIDKNLVHYTKDHYSKTAKNKENKVENGYWHSMKPKGKPKKIERDNPKTDQIKPLKINKRQYNPQSGNKLHGSKIYQNLENMDPNANSLINEPSFMESSEQVLSSLKNEISEESKLDKHVLFSQSTLENAKPFAYDHSDSKYIQDSYDMANVDYVGQNGQYHYTLPTKSSRSKEVERFINGHYQHLPFVIGQSTNKSHNLWVNIQEALSLLKQKLPQSIDASVVAPEADGEHPLSARPLSVISKLTSKSSKKPHECRAHMSEGLYDIPECVETEDSSGKSWEDNPECMQANIDPLSVRPRCSCTSQASASYKKVLRQIFGGDSVDCSEPSESNTGAREDLLQDQGGDNYKTELRKMLHTLGQEFEELNKKYEQMVLDPNSSKDELEQLEVLLENKEEEIRDIINRFNEIKDASERANVEGHRSRASFGSVEPYKSTTSIRLAQTLRQVQRFKDSLRSRPSMPYLSKNIYAQSLY